ALPAPSAGTDRLGSALPPTPPHAAALAAEGEPDPGGCMTRARSPDSPTNANGAGITSAVIYLRVSTKEQAQRDGDPEGYSIPAQREAWRRKAAALGAVIEAEFVDAGESAKTAHRPELQRMLAHVKDNEINYVIVHKIDRLARNRADDVEITLAIRAAGATL